MFVVWFQNRSAHDLDLFALAPSGIVDLAAHLLVGADADRISLALGQLGTDGAGAVGTLQRDRFYVGELLAGAVLELITADAVVLLPIRFQLLAFAVVHRAEGGASGVDGDGDVLDGLGIGLGRTRGNGDGGRTHKVLGDGQIWR